MNSNLKSIFHTEGDAVYSVLNLSLGVNLAAIGNKLYLVHCGSLPETAAETQATTTSRATSSTTTEVPKNINIVFPNGGEVLQVGDSMTFRWVSPLSVNEAVRIEIFEGGESIFLVANKINNKGTFEWNIPSDFPVGTDYKIKLTRLTAEATELPENFDFSDNVFSIVTLLPTTTTTTTTEISDKNFPDISSCRGIPILVLPDSEYITHMIKDEVKGGILFSTSKGRILGCREALVNAYLTGERKVFAEVADGFGNISDVKWTDFFYSLYRKIAEVNKSKEIVKWIYEVDPAAISTEEMSAVFLSPALVVTQDLGFWKKLIWTEQKPDNTDIVIAVRSADTLVELLAKSWDNAFASNSSDLSSTITRNLDNLRIDGKYIQFKIEMNSSSIDVAPTVVDLSITYSTKFAVYFFTTKFSLTNASDLRKGLIVAEVTEPQNTKVTFGINDTGSAEWTDYQVITLNKFFALDNIENVKVGIKLVSYGDNVAEVGEFAFMSGGQKLNLMNQSGS